MKLCAELRAAWATAAIFGTSEAVRSCGLHGQLLRLFCAGDAASGGRSICRIKYIMAMVLNAVWSHSVEQPAVGLRSFDPKSTDIYVAFLKPCM